MALNFDIEKTAVVRAAKMEKFPLFRFSHFLKDFFLFLLIVSLGFVAASFLGLTSGYYTSKIFVVLLAFYLFFGNIYLFTKAKITGIKPSGKLSEALLDLDNYNLAEFLDLQTARIVENLIRFCRKRKMQRNSSKTFR